MTSKLVTDPDEDAPDGEIVGAYERHGGCWVPLPKGTKVSIEIVFAQKTSRMLGTLITVKDDIAYVETAFGAMAGLADSVEVEE